MYLLVDTSQNSNTGGVYMCVRLYYNRKLWEATFGSEACVREADEQCSRRERGAEAGAGARAQASTSWTL